MSAAREEADRETATTGYAARFAGPVGAWFLERQAESTLALLADRSRARVLDVGGGHGQLTLPLLEAGHAVTIYASAAEALVDGARQLVDAGRAEFRHGDLLHAPWPDRAFEVVLAFRLLPHVVRWRELVGELCRLAAGAVIVDYPSRRSVNVLSESLFGIKRRIEKNTRTFSVFRDADVAAAFAERGFTATARRPQFLFPMALHRALRSATLSRAVESAGALVGLRGAFGSPVIARWERG